MKAWGFYLPHLEALTPQETLDRFDRIQRITDDVQFATWLSRHSRALREERWSMERDVKLALLEDLRREVLLGEHRK